MMRHIVINEVGPRDGLQSLHKQISLNDKPGLINALAAAGIPAVELISFVSPMAVPQMADADMFCPVLPVKDRAKFSALVPNASGVERANAAGVREIAVALGTTAIMNVRDINMGLVASPSTNFETIQKAAQHGMRPKAYVAVAFTCPFEGLVAGSKVLSLCARRIAAGGERVSAHFHDTRSLALANISAAIRYGVRKFEAVLGGLGSCPFAPATSLRRMSC